jgi:hypothetical protein
MQAVVIFLGWSVRPGPCEGRSDRADGFTGAVHRRSPHPESKLTASISSVGRKPCPMALASSGTSFSQVGLGAFMFRWAGRVGGTRLQIPPMN